jgi:phosphoribosyl 1,2-cyclic phosphodiesterase
MRFLSIASGSGGNCTYIGSDDTHILVDTGISCKKILAGLAGAELKGEDLNGILITHEHIDHIAGLGVLSRKYGLPIYASAGTIHAIQHTGSLGEIDASLFHEIQPDQDFTVGDLTVKPFAISHDAAEPLGYRVDSEKASVAVCTDLGVYTDYTVSRLQKLDAILLEANHDIRMLQVGPYPYSLKQRIMGEKGHLSNESSGRLLGEILHDEMKQILLGHLSKENNLPDLAYEAVRLEITMGDNPYDADDFPIAVADRDQPSKMIRL